MEILLWLLPSVVATLLAMTWVGWVGRASEAGPDRSEAAQERFAAAIQREHPGLRASTEGPRWRSAQPSTGVAVRHPASEPRKSA